MPSIEAELRITEQLADVSPMPTTGTVQLVLLTSLVCLCSSC